MLAILPLIVAVPLATNVTKCLADNCKAQVQSCTSDATCSAGINCVLKCPAPPTKSCVEACVSSHLDQTMLEIGLCAEGAHCIPSHAIVRDAHVDCHSIAGDAKCKQASDCSWCKSGAVPDACKTKEEARQLPSAVFDCSGI